MRRWGNILVLALLAVLLVPVSAAQAATPSSTAAAPAVPNPFEGCKDAPKPAKPLSPVGLKPDVTSDGDPFKDKGVTIESVYGNGYTFVNYDNGCKPGAGVMPNMASGIGSFGLRVPAAMSSLGHALQRSVISPTWLEEIDKAVVKATTAARDSVWTPLVGTSLLLVGVLMLWLTRAGRLDATITTATWALLVLTIVTFAANYPKDATGMVDDMVRSSATTISTGFADASESEAVSSTSDQPASRPAEQESVKQAAASSAMAAQWDEINRVTAYRTWLEGTFGDADSATAKKFGPRAFEATHMSWSEYDKVNKDPEGDGKEVLERKEKEFKKVADDIKEADPYSYSYFTGNEWMHRMGMLPLGALSGVASTLMVVISSIGMAIGLILIRVLVVFAPAMGVIFLLEPSREWALGTLSKVGKWVLLGPVFLLGGLVVLRMNSAIASSEASMWSRLMLMALVSIAAWWLIRPMGGVPRLHLGRKMMGLVKMAVLGAAAGAASNKSHDDNANDDSDSDSSSDADPNSRSRPKSGDRPVAIPSPPPPRAGLPPGEQTEPVDIGDVQVRQQPLQLRREPAELSQRVARDRSALPAGTTAGRTGGLRRAGDADERALPAGPASSSAADDNESRSGREARTGPGGDRYPSGPGQPPRQTPVGHYRPVGRVAEDVPEAPSQAQQATSSTRSDPRSPIIVPQSDPAVGEYRSAPSPAGNTGPPSPETSSPETVEASPAHVARQSETAEGPPPLPRAEAKPKPGSVQGRVLGSSEELPASINESNVQYGSEGEPVYVVYRPEGSVTYRVE